jgi:Uma2 family endonuclease
MKFQGTIFMKLPVRSTSALTLEEFLQKPETKPASEYFFDGEIYQKPMPQGQHSRLQTCLSTAINQVGEPEKLTLALTELRCTFAGQSIVPDISVFEWQRIPLNEKNRIANKFELAPDWVIEILSPEQSANKVIRKIIFCLNNGTKLGYLIDLDDESITVFQPDRLPEVKEKQDILPVLDVLKDWQLTVENVFSWLSFA